MGERSWLDVGVILDVVACVRVADCENVGEELCDRVGLPVEDAVDVTEGVAAGLLVPVWDTDVAWEGDTLGVLDAVPVAA